MFRFVHVESPDAEALAEDFRSDREAGKPPFRREKLIPELRDGMSAFGSLEAARAVWNTIRAAAEARGQEIRAGSYVAEVELVPGEDFAIEDLGEQDEHVTIWGERTKLAASVRRIYPAATPQE